MNTTKGKSVDEADVAGCKKQNNTKKNKQTETKQNKTHPEG